MIGSISAELLRLRHRLGLQLVIAGAIVVAAVLLSLTAYETRPYSAAEQSQIAQQVAQTTGQRDIARAISECVDDPALFGVVRGPDLAEDCFARATPTAANLGFRDTLDLERQRDGGSPRTLLILLAAALLSVAAAYTARDWHTGSIGTHLTLEPRRVRLWTAKAIAMTTMSLLVACVLVLGYWTALVGLSAWRDLDQAPGAVSSGYWMCLRGALVVGLGSLLGFALAMITRSAAASIGIVLMISLLGPILVPAIDFPHYPRWNPQVALLAFIHGGTSFEDTGAAGCSTCTNTVTLSTGQGGLYLLVIAVVTVVPSVLSFRVRDVH